MTAVSSTGQRAAFIDDRGVVQNVVVWGDDHEAPEGINVVILGMTESVSIGWLHNGDNTFTDPNPPPDLPAPPQPSLTDLQAQLAVIQAQISALVSKG
jgi:hypothetical protein